MTKVQKTGNPRADEPAFYNKHAFVRHNERASGHPRGCFGGLKLAVVIPKRSRYGY